jgi:hypothetical protein
VSKEERSVNKFVGSRTGEDLHVKVYTDKGAFVCDLPHKVRHSPSGIEWGYAGAGPADLALSILTYTSGERQANDLYQYFKKEFVSRFPDSGWELAEQDVLRWVARNRIQED